MMKKILIGLIVLIAIVCCCAAVSAESSDGNAIKLGDILSSSFASSQSYSGSGNSFSISNDGSINPNGNSVVDLNYEFSIDIDISKLDDKSKSSLSKISSDEKEKCNFTISDGSSKFTFPNAPCHISVSGDTLTVSGSNSAMGVHGISVDLDNCQVSKCSLSIEDGGKTTVYKTPDN